MVNSIDLKTKPNLRKRMLAGLIDYGLIFFYMSIMIYFFGQPNDEGGYTVSGLPGVSIMICWFVFTVVSEQTIGATIGNKAMRLRPAPKSDPNREVTFGQSFKRHFLDMFDLWPFGILGIIMIKNTKFNQRLGDLWAKTVVLDIRDPEQGPLQEIPQTDQY